VDAWLARSKFIEYESKPMEIEEGSSNTAFRTKTLNSIKNSFQKHKDSFISNMKKGMSRVKQEGHSLNYNGLIITSREFKDM
jgi:hypothetical protein